MNNGQGLKRVLPIPGIIVESTTIYAEPRIMSAAFCAIEYAVLIVCDVISKGRMPASMTRRLWTP